MLSLQAYYHILLLALDGKRYGGFNGTVRCLHLNRSNSFTRHPLADLSIPTSTRLPWEAFSHAAIIVRILLTHIFPPQSIARYSFMQVGELGRRGENENAQSSNRHQRRFLTWVARLRMANMRVTHASRSTGVEQEATHKNN